MKSCVDPETRATADLFRAAAAGLLGNPAAAEAPRDLLAQLGYSDGDPRAASHRAALLRAAAGFQRLFTLDAEDAPGLLAFGAEVDPGVPGVALGGVAGTGTTFGRAFESCVGEGVEYLSQFATAEDVLIPMTEAAALDRATPALCALWEQLRPYRRDPGAPLTAWTQAVRLADGETVHLPADLCFRRPHETRDIDPPWPLSTGCGAGRTLLDATIHGLLELIERDAVALWWRGGQRARLLPPGVAAERLTLLRGDQNHRRTWLLDITSDIGVPSVAAAACDDDGFGLCCGFAAHPTLAGAAEAAVMEMAQMELAYRLAATKRAVRGDAALNGTDRQHINRFTTISVAAAPALHPIAPPAPPRDVPRDNQVALLAEIREKLSACELEPYVLNLTRAAFNIPVTRVICPGLEPGLTGPPGPRLKAAIGASGIDPSGLPEL